MWLINNYIGRCAQLCSDYISRLFSDVSTILQLQNAVSEIIRWRLNTSLYDIWTAVSFAELIAIALQVPHSPLTVRSCVCWMNELAKIDQRFTIYFSAVELLHVARKISRNSFYRAMHFSANARSWDCMSSVRLSVCPSVTLVDCDHIGWKSWKLIARTISPIPSLFVAKRRFT